jgi:uncharacterized membrane protein YccF (DUF307 family)
LRVLLWVVWVVLGCFVGGLGFFWGFLTYLVIVTGPGRVGHSICDVGVRCEIPEIGWVDGVDVAGMGN